MIIDLISFAFSKNNKLDANYVFDVRFLNNPFYITELRELTGLDKKVINFFEEDHQTRNFLKELFKWVEYIIKANKKSNKEKLVIAIGCTGGQHRSPYIIECLHKYLTKKQLVSELAVYHGELKKYNVSLIS